jgi:hypothetical protein
MYTFFNISHGPAADPEQAGTVDTVSEFFELIIAPHLGSSDDGVLGFANIRKWCFVPVCDRWGSCIASIHVSLKSAMHDPVICLLDV